jgi:hypothetical protein
MPDTFDKPDAGAWLAWSVVRSLLRLNLRPASRWRVFLAVLLVSARYGGRDAWLGIDDLAALTGLSPRTVKAALAALRTGGHVVRVRRSRSLSVPLLERPQPTLEVPAGFSARQRSIILRVLAEASGLLGSEAGNLAIPTDFARRIGLRTSMTYLEAFEYLRAHGGRGQASMFVAAVLALRSDERVQGRELDWKRRT